MSINPVLFYLFAGAAILFSLLTVFKRNPVSSAFSLVLVFFCFAGIYAMLGAHLVAALQVLVYAGAIMVLFIFVIMLLNADKVSFDLNRNNLFLKIVAVLASLLTLSGFIYLLKNAATLVAVAVPTGQHTPERIAAAGGNTRVLSELLFSEYILPFELTSILLLAAILAAVAIAKRGTKNAPTGGQSS